MKVVVHRTDGVAHNDTMDPVVAALAQLVRDRYVREQRDRAVARERLRIVVGPGR